MSGEAMHAGHARARERELDAVEELAAVGHRLRAAPGAEDPARGVVGGDDHRAPVVVERVRAAAAARPRPRRSPPGAAARVSQQHPALLLTHSRPPRASQWTSLLQGLSLSRSHYEWWSWVAAGDHGRSFLAGLWGVVVLTYDAGTV